LFLCYLGFKTLFSRPAESPVSDASRGLWGDYVSTFFLTLTNPLTTLSFAAVFAGLGLASAVGDYTSAGFLVLGVFTGSAAWWLLLSGAVSMLRARFNTSGLVWVNRLSGGIILIFGAAALASLLDITT
jgi:threonine/homoserine/homoserine lactone efflux protein